MQLTRENFQYDLLKTEMELCQQQMDKYDQIGVSIKTWVITLWVASLSFMLQLKEPRVAVLLVIILFFFWLFEGVNKNFREDYKDRRDEIVLILQIGFDKGEFPDHTIAPHFPEHHWQGIFIESLRFHVALFYCTLIAVAATMYFLV